MTVRHWVWIVWGLLAWAALVMAWATSPVGCQPPDAQHRVTCTGRVAR